MLRCMQYKAKSEEVYINTSLVLDSLCLCYVASSFNVQVVFRCCASVCEPSGEVRFDPPMGRGRPAWMHAYTFAVYSSGLYELSTLRLIHLACLPLPASPPTAAYTPWA